MLKVVALVLVAMLAGGYAAYRIKARPVAKAPSGASSQRGPQSERLEDVIAFLSAEAVASARDDFGKELDFSIKSIRTVDEILEQLHQQVQAKPNTGGINGLASIYGAYIGECIRRSEQNVRWEQDHPTAGPRSYPLHWKGGESFPMAWCLKRIKYGPEDMLWFKYTTLKEQREAEAKQRDAAGPRP